MKNINKMNINELKEILSQFFEEDVADELLKLPRHEIINILEAEAISTLTDDLVLSQKHVPSRKKKAKRISKSILKIKHNKNKKKKWQEGRRINVPDEDTTNRSYLNKASKVYTKLYPHIKLSSKEKNLKILFT